MPMPTITPDAPPTPIAPPDERPHRDPDYPPLPERETVPDDPRTPAPLPVDPNFEPEPITPDPDAPLPRPLKSPCRGAFDGCYLPALTAKL